MCEAVFGTTGNLGTHFKRASHAKKVRAAGRPAQLEQAAPAERHLSKPGAAAAKRAAEGISAQKYHCAVCKKAFGKRADLKLHLDTVAHAKKAKAAGLPAQLEQAALPEKRPLKSDGATAKRRAVDARRVAVTIERKEFFCAICNNALPTRQALQRHLDGGTHTKKAKAAAGAENNRA